jgi:hypothetical protein
MRPILNPPSGNRQKAGILEPIAWIRHDVRVSISVGRRGRRVVVLPGHCAPAWGRPLRCSDPRCVAVRHAHHHVPRKTRHNDGPQRTQNRRRAYAAAAPASSGIVADVERSSIRNKQTLRPSARGWQEICDTSLPRFRTGAKSGYKQRRAETRRVCGKASLSGHRRLSRNLIENAHLSDHERRSNFRTSRPSADAGLLPGLARVIGR